MCPENREGGKDDTRPPPEAADKFKEALHYNYIYLSESEIEAKLINIDGILDVYNEDLSNDYEYFTLIDLLQNIDKITIEDKHALRDINYDRFVTKVFKP